MTSEPARLPLDRRAVLLLTAIALMALGVRLYHIDRRGITHPELFAPGIPLPSYTVEPRPRYTFREVIRDTLTGDIHPPAYYLGARAWTKVAGTSLFALRVPSALLGMAAVVLLFFYGRREAGTSVALVAAALLALHGHHVFWSQHARMWVPLSCLAVASALLLARVIERPGHGIIVAYAAVAAAGVWTDYYAWPFFLALTVCAAAAVADRRRVAALDAQVLAGVFASPMLVFLHYQMQRGNFLGPELREPLLSIVPMATVSSSRVVTAPLAAIAGLAVVVGMAARRSQGVDVSAVHKAEPLPAVFFVVGSVLASAFVILELRAIASRLTIVLAVALPWFASLAWLAARSRIERLAPAPNSRVERFARSIVGHMPASLVVTTLAILLTIHLVREPVMVSRGLVMLAPLVALLMARGVFALRLRPARIALAVVLLAASAGSTVQSYARRNSPRDYQELAAQLLPQIRAGDVVLVENGYWTTPIHYYLPPDRFRLIEAKDVTAPLPARVWIVTFHHNAAGEVATADALAAAKLPHYVKVRQASGLLGYAVLFEPASPTSASAQ